MEVWNIRKCQIGMRILIWRENYCSPPARTFISLYMEFVCMEEDAYSKTMTRCSFLVLAIRATKRLCLVRMFIFSLDIRYSRVCSPEYLISTCLDVVDIQPRYSGSISSYRSQGKNRTQRMSRGEARHRGIFAPRLPLCSSGSTSVSPSSRSIGRA